VYNKAAPSNRGNSVVGPSLVCRLMAVSSQYRNCSVRTWFTFDHLNEMNIALCVTDFYGGLTHWWAKILVTSRKTSPTVANISGVHSSSGV